MSYYAAYKYDHLPYTQTPRLIFINICPIKNASPASLEKPLKLKEPMVPSFNKYLFSLWKLISHS